MLFILLCASGLLAGTVVIHALGTAGLIHLARRWRVHDQTHVYTIWRGVRLLVLTMLILFSLHVLEVCLWAEAYLLFDPPQTDTFEAAVYFSFVTFSTLGYGDITFDQNWRVLTGIQATNGILIFGWSTAILIGVVQRVFVQATRHDAGSESGA